MCRICAAMAREQRHIHIHGKVQGVGYRFFATRVARRLGLKGFIQNNRDGSVEAVLAGSEEVVLTMIELCRDGPPGAQVTAIDQREAGAVDLALRRPGDLFSVLAGS